MRERSCLVYLQGRSRMFTLDMKVYFCPIIKYISKDSVILQLCKCKVYYVSFCNTMNILLLTTLYKRNLTRDLQSLHVNVSS
jgi:hypothetical protein